MTAIVCLDNNDVRQTPSLDPTEIVGGLGIPNPGQGGPLNVRIKRPWIDWNTFALMKSIGLTPAESLLFLRILTGAKQKEGRWYVDFGTTQASKRSGMSRHRAIDLKRKLQASGAGTLSRPGVKGLYVDEWDITSIMEQTRSVEENAERSG